MPEAREASNQTIGNEGLNDQEQSFLKDPDAALEYLNEQSESENKSESKSDDQPEPQESKTTSEEPAKPAKTNNKSNTVPHAKFHAERERRKELEAELNKLKTQQNQEQQQNNVNNIPQYVDPVVDQEGYRRWAEYRAQLPMAKIKQLEENAQVQQAVQDVHSKLNYYDQEMMKINPDYENAVEWAKNNRVTSMIEAGYTQDEANKQLAQDVYNLFRAAEAAGISPAKLFYDKAIEDGYVSKNTGDEGTQLSDQEKRIDALNKAQANTQTMSQTGESQAGKMTLKTAASLSERDFAKLSKDEIDRLLSGG